jgi:hypothetical protein
MGVDADILTLALSRQFAVGMPMNVPGSVMGFVPHLEGVVTADDQLLLPDIMHHQLEIIIAAPEKLAIAGVIVIAKNEMMLAIETLDDASRLFRRRKGEVAKMDHDIVFPDHGIVAEDQFFVHLLDILEGPLGVFDDVLVKPMLIAGEEDLPVFELVADFHDFTPASGFFQVPFCSSSQLKSTWP